MLKEMFNKAVDNITRFLSICVAVLIATLLVSQLSHVLERKEWIEVNTHLHSEINKIIDYYEQEVDFWFKATLECEQSSPSTYYPLHPLEPTKLEM